VYRRYTQGDAGDHLQPDPDASRWNRLCRRLPAQRLSYDCRSRAVNYLGYAHYAL